jgi:aryl-alcohol dehydrogenase-like predicted oxidoreductase
MIPHGEIPGLDRPVSRLVLGCGPFRPDEPARAEAVLDAFAAAGGTALDTAYVYGRDGASERAVGRWLAARGCRERMVVITKGGHPDGEWRPRIRADVIDAELAQSLERLGTDCVDLYLLHRDDPGAPVGPILECLNGHVEAGRIRAFGGSNWAPARLAEANAFAAAHGLRGMAASSPHLALAIARDPAHMGHSIVSADAEALRWYARTRMPLLAWTAQAQGFFSDRARPGDPESARRFRRYDHADNWERHRRAHELAARLRKSPTQVALAWVLGQPGDVYPIIGPGTVPHLQEAVDALEIRLSPAERAWLNLEA